VLDAVQKTKNAEYDDQIRQLNQFNHPFPEELDNIINKLETDTSQITNQIQNLSNNIDDLNKSKNVTFEKENQEMQLLREKSLQQKRFTDEIKNFQKYRSQLKTISIQIVANSKNDSRNLDSNHRQMLSTKSKKLNMKSKQLL
jgi:tetrahydrodipicolinate N-succinyltransferase